MAQTAEAAATSGVHPRDVVNKYLWWVIVFSMAIAIAFGIKHEQGSKDADSAKTGGPRSEIPLVSSPQSSWPTLTIPAKGKVELIPYLYSKYPHARIVGMRVQVTGTEGSFRLYIQYANGNKCVIPDEVCALDGIVEMSVGNKLSETNIVSYAFAPG